VVLETVTIDEMTLEVMYQCSIILTLYGHIKTLYINTVIGTLAVDGWAVTFITARRGLGELRPHSVSSSLYQL